MRKKRPKKTDVFDKYLLIKLEMWGSKKLQCNVFWTGGLVLAVQQVDAVDVVMAHLPGRAKHGFGVWNSHHGGVLVVFGESQP